MPVNSVVVHDIQSLREFNFLLCDKKDEIKTLYETLLSACARQRTNWQDPQYEVLRDQLTDYVAASQQQLEQLEGSINYIANLIARLTV